MKNNFAHIALNLPLNKLFTYSIPEIYKSQIEKGMRVLVPFGKKTVTGVAIEIIDESDLKGIKDIKTIIDKEKIINDEMLEFAKWISDYYIAPIGEVLFSFIPRQTNIQSDYYYSLTDDYKNSINKLKAFNEYLYSVINCFKENKKILLTKKQIENKLKIADSSKYLNTLTVNNIIKAERLFNKPVQDKYVKIITRNFDIGDIDKIINDNKIKSDKQINFLNMLFGKESFELPELIKQTGISAGSVNTLYKKELIKIDEIKKEREFTEIYSEETKDIVLNDEQKICLEEINKSISANEFKTFLLYGVTGSGKTEVYINVIKTVLKENKTAIVLVPEISLTPQLIHRFKRNFGNQVGVLHSKVSDGERIDTFEKIKRGEYKIIIGARSALFAPLKNIGIIVTDEEHDSSYKQENSPKYNARDAAIIRAKINNCTVVLGSGTPSVESYYNAVSGKYKLLELKNRATNIKMPEIKIIDLKHKQSNEEYKNDIFNIIEKVRIRFLSKDLIYEIGERLDKKENVIILQNRRGYHSYLECINCGEVEMCKRCSIALTYHKALNVLKCHYCGYSKSVTGNCSNCGVAKFIPMGAGTEKVEEELIKIFPKAVIERLDSDSMGSRKKYQTILKDFYDRKIDILVGTQMISKGLDFPNVTLVGVVNADIGLLNPDFRATEKTFQLLTQVSGRSGRSEKKGEVIIQTNHSEFFVFNDVKEHNYSDFIKKELSTRKEMSYPPYSRIAVIEAKALDSKLCESKIKEIYNLITEIDKKKILNILPPHPPLFSKLKDMYRYHLLIKSLKEKDIAGSYLIKMLKYIKEYADMQITSRVRISIDMDAVNLM